jgi:hypothetical protein
MNERINCFKCQFLQITWQPQFPYACKIMGFKSKMIPSMEVFRNSGIACQTFTAKPETGKK